MTHILRTLASGWILLLIPFVLPLLQVHTACGQSHTPPRKYEVRAVWITTNYGLDWPKRPALDQQGERRQQQELIKLLDGLQQIGFNTIYLQVRSQGELIYPSRFEPLSSYFTKGSRLGYDPLAFAIEEIHRRGMAVHAWYSVLPIGKRLPASSRLRTSTSPIGYDAVRHRGYYYMDPTSERTISFLRAEIRELVTRYEIDGVHLDYIRYPDRTNGFPDARQFRDSGKEVSLGTWRRSHISAIVEGIYNEIKSCDSTVALSAATIGTYAPIPGYKTGWNARDAVFQDPVAWLQGGYIDFIVPMHYTRGATFEPIIRDWTQRFSSKLVMGLGAYRILPHEGHWAASEVVEQTQTSLSYPEVSGVAYFRAEQLVSDGRLTDLGQRIKALFSKYSALPPSFVVASTSTKDRHISAPSNIEATITEQGLQLSWSSSNSGHVLYAIYARRGGEYPDTSAQTRDLVAVTTHTTALLPLSELLSADEDDMLVIELSTYDWRLGVEVFSLSGAAYVQHVE